MTTTKKAETQLAERILTAERAADAAKAEVAGLNAKLAEQKAQIEKLTKEAESNRISYSYQCDRASKAEQAMEELHCFLDAVPNRPPRMSGDETTESYKRITFSPSVRLCAWIAGRTNFTIAKE